MLAYSKLRCGVCGGQLMLSSSDTYVCSRCFKEYRAAKVKYDAYWSKGDESELQMELDDVFYAKYPQYVDV